MCPRRANVTVSPRSNIRASASVMISNVFMFGYDSRAMAEYRLSHVLLTSDQIQSRVSQMAKEIRADYPNGLHIVAVLKGAFMFLSDLVRYVEGQVSMDF